MDWSTVAVEIIERILLFTGSPRTIISASYVCKNWKAIGDDQIVWKELYYATSAIGLKYQDEVDWKKKVMDGVLIRNNVAQGRCIVKTLSTGEPKTNRVDLTVDNTAVYKDFHLVTWQTIEHFGSYGDVQRLNSHFVNMVTEEYIELDEREVTLINKYVTKSPSEYYGGISYADMRVHEIDEEKIREGRLFLITRAVKLNLPRSDHTTRSITNYCLDSKYLGFYSSEYQGPSQAYILDAETGSVVFETPMPYDRTNRFFGLYDNYFAVRPWDTLGKHKFLLVDVVTKNRIKKRFEAPYEFCFMRKDEVAFRCENKFIIWNYKNNTEKEYPVGQAATQQVKMIYHDMWVTGKNEQSELLISFFDMNDGSQVGSLFLRGSYSGFVYLSELSDGRLAVSTRTGCHVISFLNSEVTRNTKVLLMDIEGTVTEHEIMACKLPEFYRQPAKGFLRDMTSRVVPYQPHAEDERYVMVFSQASERPKNAKATELFKNAVQPTQINTPYQGWRTDGQTIECRSQAVTQVYGPVVIVKERKIDGRWQLV